MRKCSNFELIKTFAMKRIMIVVLLASLLTGCSTAYRTGQTPDDVYFSPAMNRGEYLAMEEEGGYNVDRVPMTDRYLRMKTNGRSRWMMFDDDFAYWNNPVWNNRSYFDLYTPNTHFGFGNSWMNWNRFPMGNGMFFGNNLMFGNPFAFNPFSPMYYGQPVVMINNFKPMVTNPRANTPRTYSLNNYVAPRSYADPKSGNSIIRSGSTNRSGQYINSNGTPRGGYNPRSNGDSYGSPVRTFSNSSSSGSSYSNGSSGGSSSGGSSSGGSAPVRTFPRGGN